MDEERRKFEAWVSSPPFEKSIARYPDDPQKYAWPGGYRKLDVQMAWEAWQEASKQAAE